MKVSEIMVINKATSINDIPFTCGYYPLDSEALNGFYIDTSDARGIDVLSRLKKRFNIIIDGIYQQILFLGHMGTGKSTIMYKLEKSLSSKYTVIRFSVQKYLDLDKITFIDLLCVMYRQILELCTKSERIRKNFEKVYNSFYETIEVETENKRIFELDCNGKIEVSANGFIKLISSLTSSMKASKNYREKIHKIITIKLDQYIENLNNLIKVVEEDSQKPILLMFEELEKIPYKNALEIFKTYGSYFQNIKSHMLITTPISLKYSTDYKQSIISNFTSMEKCPMLAVANPDGTDYDAGINTLRKIIKARVSESLIEDEALTNAIKYSGGVLRDLFSMISNASILCNNNEIITIDKIEDAFCSLKESMQEELRSHQIEILQRVYNNPFALLEDDEELKLMTSEIIIEYNGKQWRGIHPAAFAYLNDNKLIEKKRNSN